MNALRLVAPNAVELRDVPVPSPDPDWLLIRTGATTICTSDLADIRSNPFGLQLPVVLGHEAAGTVEAVGDAVTEFQLGDRIAAHPVHPCRDCDECSRGLGHLCSHLSHFGIDLQGTFAEYFLVRADRARKIPDEMSFAVAALAEPVCVALEAVQRAAVRSGESLLIIGDGPFGLLMTRIANLIGGFRVIVAGRHDTRLALAKPAQTVNTRELANPARALCDASGAGGFDAVILAVADPTAVALGLELLRARGRLVVFAPIHGETGIDLSRVLMKELEIRGAVNDENLFDDAIALLSDPAFGAADFISARFRLNDFPQALELAATAHHRVIKVAFEFCETAMRTHVHPETAQ